MRGVIKNPGNITAEKLDGLMISLHRNKRLKKSLIKIERAYYTCMLSRPYKQYLCSTVFTSFLFVQATISRTVTIHYLLLWSRFFVHHCFTRSLAFR
jgi:hypothetical protein